MLYSDKKITVTLAKAQEFLDINEYSGQRRRRIRGVNELKAKLLDGKFHLGQIAVIHNDGVSLLANGQHQCMAAIQAGKSFRAILQEWTVEASDTNRDVASVFSQYNVDVGRTRADIAWIHACQCGMEDWPRKVVVLCNTSLGWLENRAQKTGYHTTSKEDNAELLGHYRKECEFLLRMLANVENRFPKHMMRSPVAAAMIGTWRKNRESAETFWAAVRDGEMLRRGSPAKKLRDWLILATVKTGGQDRKVVGHLEMFVKCIHAWNAHRKGKTTMLNYFAKSPIPPVV